MAIIMELIKIMAARYVQVHIVVAIGSVVNLFHRLSNVQAGQGEMLGLFGPPVFGYVVFVRSPANPR